jgi:hypothetical protein
MLMTAGMMVIAFGLICLFDSDLAWFIHEADARLFGKELVKSAHWENQMMIQGFCLIIVGGIGIFLGLGILG